MIDRDLRQHGWLAGREHAEKTHELAGRTLGVIGVGSVGKAVMAIARNGFGLDVIANSRNAEEPAGRRALRHRRRAGRRGRHRRALLPADAGDGGAAQPRAHSPDAAGLDPGQRVARRRGRRCRPDRGAARRPDRRRRTRRLRDAAAAGRPSLFRLRQCDRHAAHGGHHRRKHDAHGRSAPPRRRSACSATTCRSTCATRRSWSTIGSDFPRIRHRRCGAALALRGLCHSADPVSLHLQALDI